MKGSSNETDKSEHRSGIRDFALKVDLDYLPSPSHNFKFGAMGVHHTFTPGVSFYTYKLTSESFDIDQNSQEGSKIRALEFSAYAEDDITISDRTRFNIGVHTSLFNVRKKSFSSIQPRLSGRFLLDPKTSVKASCSIMRQFVQLLTNSDMGLSTDLWIPATDKLKPLESW